MARESGGNFELPAEMRAFAEKSVEQAKQACESFLAAAQNAVNTAGSQVTTAQSGAKEAGELAMRFAQRNIAASFEFAQKLARAKDPQEVIALHAEYASEPNRGAERPGQGIEAAGGENRRAGGPLGLRRR